ncbi:hypothetical protein GUJ93_ZPchr0002g26017 [Zizania palustris]|uniref:Cytochrome P450 n=1 Tax=Zizania palustris TaxID=103762 RepID=A0A8J5RR04_ZIZPA|nr:hypothetical protein GUJ93_ZPchr0002g26017 [Zizania palustris]
MGTSEVWLRLLWAALAGSVLFYLAVLRRYSSGGKLLPPGPTPLPVIGNLHNLGGVVHHKIANLARIYGPVMSLKLGFVNTVVVSSRDAAKEAIVMHDRRLAARLIPDTFRACGFADRSAVFLPSADPHWKALRGIQGTNVFTPRGLAALRPIRERKVRELLDYFRPRAGEELHIRHAIHTAMLNMVSTSFFSMDIADFGSDTAHELRDLGLRRLSEKRFSRVYSILDDIIAQRLAHTEANLEKHDDFLDALLEVMATGKMEREYVMAMLFEAFVAGGDSIAFSVEWVMAELLRNPHVMAKARAELKDVVGSKQAVDEPDTANLPYLQAVIKESMRLHPPGPLLLPHLAVEDGVEIGGYAVPKGTAVMFNAFSIMRDPAAWDTPDEFMPERFLQRATPVDFRGKEVDFLPFGTGRRLCPGVPLVERVLPLVLASLIHAFQWRLPAGMSPEDMDMSERFMTTNTLAVPLKVVPIIAN